jgi:hypothetical protein
MKLEIDHVTLGASRLEALAGAFAAASLAADYGGLHANGITHMSQVAFDDGSYVELVSVTRPGQPSPWWQEHIVREGGPCAWAVRVEDVDGEVQRLRARGVTVGDPTCMQRKRSDGQAVEWDLAFVGELGAGAMHPFIIKDRTPRELRVPNSESVAGSELLGVHKVVLGVEDVAAASEIFQDAYDLPPRRTVGLPNVWRSSVRLPAPFFSALGTPTRPGNDPGSVRCRAGAPPVSRGSTAIPCCGVGSASSRCR